MQHKHNPLCMACIERAVCCGVRCSLSTNLSQNQHSLLALQCHVLSVDVSLSAIANLGARVLQDVATEQVAEALHLFQEGMHDPKTPLVMLFMGPSRTGKTETAKQIAKVLGSRGVDIHLDMAQFSQAHEAANLHGAPLGYKGSEQGTLLSKISSFTTPAVVLLDEMDKAHPDVRQFFLAVFDEGKYTAPDGKVVDCSGAVFIMTTNIGADVISQEVCQTPVHVQACQQVGGLLFKILLKCSVEITLMVDVLTIR